MNTKRNNNSEVISTLSGSAYVCEPSLDLRHINTIKSGVTYDLLRSNIKAPNRYKEKQRLFLRDCKLASPVSEFCQSDKTFIYILVANKDIARSREVLSMPAILYSCYNFTLKNRIIASDASDFCEKLPANFVNFAHHYTEGDGVSYIWSDFFIVDVYSKDSLLRPAKMPTCRRIVNMTNSKCYHDLMVCTAIDVKQDNILLTYTALCGGDEAKFSLARPSLCDDFVCGNPSCLEA